MAKTGDYQEPAVEVPAPVVTARQPGLLLTAAAISAAGDIATRDLEVPEWGGAVRLRMLTAAQREALGLAMSNAVPAAADGEAATRAQRLERMRVMRRELLRMSLVDAAGAELFTSETIDLLFARAPDPVDRLFAEAMAFNKMGPAAGEAEKKA